MDSAKQADTRVSELITRIELEMAELQFPGFTLHDSLSLGQRLVTLGADRGLPIAIDISRANQVLFHVALPGATPDNDLWAAAKARTAARYQEPSYLVGLRAQLSGTPMEDNPLFDTTVFAAHGGSFPLYVRGVGPVATVTVSGLPQRDDHDLVVEALRGHLDA
ncbi:heme-degrading domain-containing protein [Arthrobacter sp. CAN_A1]|uniref:heme-degrading domain-containing protein n=1 Tax=Arthrobacter sp. CAN_A1 TaxID=2787717 RepID=UPI0018C950B8